MDYHINVIDHEGIEHKIPARVGMPVMRLISDAGLPIRAECGGCCSCATCHVHVDEGWYKIVGAPDDEEEGTLDSAMDLGDTSRLSCQLSFVPEWDGLTVTLTQDTL